MKKKKLIKKVQPIILTDGSYITLSGLNNSNFILNNDPSINKFWNNESLHIKQNLNTNLARFKNKYKDFLLF